MRAILEGKLYQLNYLVQVYALQYWKEITPFCLHGRHAWIHRLEEVATAH
jgi:hypothetical protein